MTEEQKTGMEFVAGVFFNPETKEFEIQVGREGVDPITVFADAVVRYMENVKQVRRSPIERAPPGMKV